MATFVASVIAIVFGLMSLGMAMLIIKGVVSSTWNLLAKAFPGIEPAPDAVRRDFQSFKMGLLNLGWCVHVAADEGHLHLAPAAFIRVFGARRMSIPWDQIQVRRKGLLGGTVLARIGKIDVWGPKWCMELASNAA